MRRIALVMALLTVVGLAVVGAAVSRPERASGGRATVLAAASLTEVLPKIDPDARVSFGGSNQLAQQVRLGFPVDVFLSANPKYVRDLYREGLVRKPVVFASNSLVLIVPRRNPAHIRAVGDLTSRSNLRLVVGGPAVPVGLYTREVLQRLKLLRVLRKAVSLEPDVKGIVGKVALGEADAGFVYATDVGPVANKVRVIPFPRRAQPTVRYEAAIATRPHDLEAARAFMTALLGNEGRKALRAAGFGLPE